MFPRFKVKYLNIIITIVQRAEMKCNTSVFRKRSDDGFQYCIYYISDRIILEKIRNNNHKCIEVSIFL